MSDLYQKLETCLASVQKKDQILNRKWRWSWDPALEIMQMRSRSKPPLTIQRLRFSNLHSCRPQRQICIWICEKCAGCDHAGKSALLWRLSNDGCSSSHKIDGHDGGEEAVSYKCSRWSESEFLNQVNFMMITDHITTGIPESADRTEYWGTGKQISGYEWGIQQTIARGDPCQCRKMRYRSPGGRICAV